MKELLKRIEEVFNEKLRSKTGWGRNEVSALFKDSVIEVLVELTAKKSVI